MKEVVEQAFNHMRGTYDEPWNTITAHGSVYDHKELTEALKDKFSWPDGMKLPPYGVRWGLSLKPDAPRGVVALTPSWEDR